jgi:hypothetical protein
LPALYAGDSGPVGLLFSADGFKTNAKCFDGASFAVGIVFLQQSRSIRKSLSVTGLV